MPLPDFLIVGFPRCGTSFLLKTLPKHTRIHIPEEEVNFYGNPNKSLEIYKDYFRENMINGEKTPGYILRKQAMNEIRHYSPQAKLIICVRHPVQALHSFYAHRVREFYKGLPPGFDPQQYPFHDIVLEDLNINMVSTRTYNFMYHINSNMQYNLDNQQLKVVINEEMRNDSNSLLSSLFSFIGVKNEKIALHSPRFYDEKMRYAEIDYSSEKYRHALMKLINYYKPGMDKFYEFFGREIPAWKEIDVLYEKAINQ